MRSSNRDTHCSNLALDRRAEAWQNAAEAPAVDTKRSSHIMEVTFNWKHLTKDSSEFVSAELSDTFVFVTLADVAAY